MPEPLYEVWRRPRGSREGWRKVPDLDPMERHDAFQSALAQHTVAGEVEWEYAIFPVGIMPTDQRSGKKSERFHEGYRTKRSKPE